MKNALVVYSGWTGATKEIAHHIAQTLEKHGLQTQEISAEENIDLSTYDLIIIGTSIHASRTTSGFRKFLKQNIENLSDRPFAFFVSCANMMNDTDDSRAETLAWLHKGIQPYDSIEPISIGLFGGAVVTSGESFSGLNFFVRRIIKTMEKKMISDYGKADFRDWGKIEAWVLDLIKKTS